MAAAAEVLAGEEIDVDISARTQADADELAVGQKHGRHLHLLDRQGVVHEALAVPLLELEAALDSFVNSQVEQIASTKLSGKSKEEMLYLLRRQSDLRAIADIYRLKSVLRADRAFIKKRVSLSVSNMTPRQLDNLMDAQDAQDVIHRLVNTPYASEFYGASFDYIEEGVRKIDYRWHLKKLRFSTNPSVVLFCYIFLAENELINIVHIIEGVRYGLAPDDIATLLVGVGD